MLMDQLTSNPYNLAAQTSLCGNTILPPSKRAKIRTVMRRGNFQDLKVIRGSEFTSWLFHL